MNNNNIVKLFVFFLVITSFFSVLIRSVEASDRTDDSQSWIHAGRVEEVQYTVSDESKLTKSAFVYLPYGYDENDFKYDIVYLLHGSTGSSRSYFDTECITDFQKSVDLMIGQGIMAPVIIVAPTYFSDRDSQMKLPLCENVKLTAKFPRELAEDIIPAVESRYRTYAESTDENGLCQSRDHRTIGGFSLGAVATWFAFTQKLSMFHNYIPVSEVSWDDGKGGIIGDTNLNFSAQVIRDSVYKQGFTGEDFSLVTATGTFDTAFFFVDWQMKVLLHYQETFQEGENTFYYLYPGGKHCFKYGQSYIINALLHYFPGAEIL